jgi:hypothetical protein
MGTNYQGIATRPVTTSLDATPARSLWSRAIGHLQSAVCGLHGHDPLMHFEQGRMFLRCTSCGYETPGWSTGDRRPRQRFTGDARRHQLHDTSPAGTQSTA